MKEIPQYPHLPIQVLWWEMDVFIMGAMGLFVWLFVLGGYIPFFIAILVPYAYSKIKKKNNRGFFLHLPYMIGFKKMQGYPDYFIANFHE